MSRFLSLSNRRIMSALIMSQAISIFIPNYLSGQEEVWTEVLAKHEYTWQVKDGTPEGSLVQFFQEEANKSQFFVFAERRYTQEIPGFISSFYNVVQPYEFNNIGLEIGPIAAKTLTALIEKGEKSELKRFFAETPGSIPYYDHLEEAQLIVDVIGNGGKIWGLDQESNASLKYNIRQLEKLASNAKQRELAQNWMTKIEAGEKEEAPVLLNTLSSEDLNQLDLVFRRKAKAGEVIKRLKESADIYALFNEKKYYESNLERTRLMKQYFEEYTKTGKEKVIVKTNRFFAERGTNGMHMYGLGNYLTEKASGNNTDSFHILITAQRYLRDDKERDLKSLTPDLEGLESIVNGQEIKLFDLRPLREHIFMGRLKGLAPGLINTIHQFDAVLVFPELKHANDKFD